MTRDEFTFQYRKLCNAFGTAYHEGRANVYYDRFQNVTQAVWRAMTDEFIEGGSSFPKISDLVRTRAYMDRNRDSGGPVEDPYRAWVEEDCTSKSCLDGFVPVAVKDRKAVTLFPGNWISEHELYERSLTFLCPVCRKMQDEYPNMPFWRGPTSLRSPEEMAERRRERESRYREMKGG